MQPVNSCVFRSCFLLYTVSFVSAAADTKGCRFHQGYGIRKIKKLSVNQKSKIVNQKSKI